VIVRDASFFTPPYTALIVAVAAALTLVVVTGNVAELRPAGTLMVAGTLAAELLLESATVTPPAEASPASVTVPVDPAPPTTVAGLTETLESDGPVVIVRAAVFVTPFSDALIVAVTVLVTLPLTMLFTILMIVLIRSSTVPVDAVGVMARVVTANVAEV
jgi:hypothetical protein